MRPRRPRRWTFAAKQVRKFLIRECILLGRKGVRIERGKLLTRHTPQEFPPFDMVGHSLVPTPHRYPTETLCNIRDSHFPWGTCVPPWPFCYLLVLSS